MAGIMLIQDFTENSTFSEIWVNTRVTPETRLSENELRVLAALAELSDEDECGMTTWDFSETDRRPPHRE